MITTRVIQGAFLGGQPKLASVQPRVAPPPIQAKLAVPPPATTFAARLPGPPVPAFAPGPPAPAFAGRPGAVQRQAAGGAFAVEAGALGLAAAGGRALPDSVRGRMEAALGADFSAVRVHVGPQAERIGAIAFTLGSDIYFAPGRYQPDTVPGRQLLGHELAHVVQQRAGRVRNPLGSGIAVVQDHALEAEADRLGRHAASGPIAPQVNIQRTANLQSPGPPHIAAPPRIQGNRPQTVQSASRNARVIQRIGQEVFGYEINATHKLQDLTSQQWAEEAKKDKPLAGLVPIVGPSLTLAQWRELSVLTSILVNTIETLRLRENMWKGAKERQLSATLTTLTDQQKVRKIKDILHGFGYSVPATNDLTTLKNEPDVIELLEISPRLKREVEWAEPADRHVTIMTHALTVDAPVASAVLPSRVFDFATLQADPILKALMTRDKLSWADDGSKHQIKTEEGIVLLTFYHKDEAFVQKQSADSAAGIHRPVFSKRGKEEGPRNEYVKDDKGVFTRRRAYLEKNKYQFRDLANKDSLIGRYPTQQSERENATIAYNRLDEFAQNAVPALGGSASFTNAYQLAYLHQELGSGHQQRGVSATSSPKYDIFSNAGKSFRTDDGVRIEVDLARIPQGTDTEPQLINHYGAAAREKMRPLIGTYITKGRTFDHYEWSVKKNRELFIKEVKSEHITALSLHQTAAGNAHQEIKPGGFRQTDIAALGDYVGLAAYNAGFAAGSNNNRSQPAAFLVDKQKYYLEGYADGQEYKAGYEMGNSRRRRLLKNADKDISDMRDDKKVRYQQGFWDGYHNRPKRRN